MRRLGALPLVYQPGERWMYHTGSDVLGVLIARAAGQTLDAFLRERIFAPLGMKDTGFWVPPEKLSRLPPSYAANPETRVLTVHDDPRDPQSSHLARFSQSFDALFAEPPAFPSGGGGLVSTVDDYHAFCQMMLNKGRHGSDRILSRPSIELMTTDHLTAEQRESAQLFLGDGRGWGFGLSVVVRRTDFAALGRLGWDGGFGTSGYSDPAEGLVGILMTQRLMDSPEPPRAFLDFWTSVYRAIDD